MTKRRHKVLMNVLVGVLLLTAICVHIAFLWWERDGFAPGSEWAIYFVIVIAFVKKVLYYDD